ncbi:MAG TPA: T9SS type A sorting domain-containing protein, partial [Lentimicrobium sp.]|nr:T9SS type A sorting domain-containing protein [Lentimicrobium sp.]
ECLGIDNIGKAEIKILPNPTNGLFSVEISGMPELLKFRISVTDARGEVIVDQAHQSNGSLFKTKLDLSNYAKGIYLLKLSAGVEATVVKVIVQ